MKSGTDPRTGPTARSTGRRRRAMGSVAAALGAWAIAFTGLAPAATADDVRSQEWYLDAMQLEKVWKVSTGQGITVAVVDSGVTETPALKGQLLPGKNLTGRSGGTNDDDGHGTTMAELIAGTGEGGGLKGVAPGAKVIPFRVSSKDTPGAGQADDYKGVRAAADSDARIINMSFGGPENFTFDEDAVNYALKRGKLLFAGVGNDGNGKASYPAAYPGVVGVSAVDKNYSFAEFSQHGKAVDVAAPGAAIPSRCDATFKSYCTGQGTSQATAIASASAALIWSAHPDWTANQVLRVLIDTAGRDWPKDKPSTYLGYGSVRPARNLLHGEGDPGAADTDPVSGKKIIGVPAATDAPSGASSAPESSSDGTSGQKAASGGETSAASDEGDSGGGGQMWTIVGAVAAVVVIGGAVFAFTRTRRAR